MNTAKEIYQLSKDQIAALLNDVIEIYHEHLVRHATKADDARDVAIDNGLMWLEEIKEQATWKQSS